MPLATARSKRRGKPLRLLGRRFDVGGDDVDLRALGLICEIVGGVEDNLVAAAGAEVKAEAAFSARVDQEIHHAAALKDAADVSRAEILRQLAAPDAELGAHRNEPHAIGSEKFDAGRFCGFGQLLLQLFSCLATFGEAVGKNDSGLDAFFPRIFDNGRHCFIVDRDHCQGNFSRDFENARIGFQSENLGTAGVDGYDARRVEPHALQIPKYVDRVVIAVAGANNRKTVGFEERR